MTADAVQTDGQLGSPLSPAAALPQPPGSASPAPTSAEPPPGTRRRNRLRRARISATICGILVLLFGVPWWTIVVAGSRWPTWAVVAGTAVFAASLLALPMLMMVGHGRYRRDWAARIGDTMLGLVWVFFSWALVGDLVALGLAISGVPDPQRSRLVAVAVAGVSAVLVAWGYREAMRVPRIRRVEVTVDRLGAGLDGTRVVLLTDTHYGPINRAVWSARVIAAVNSLDADIVCHAGDIADGDVTERRRQAAPLADVRARLARIYVTGNHEYFGQAQQWLDHMRELGWQALHNEHVVVERGGDRLILAGVDDATAARSGRPGHHADHAAALAGTDRQLPVLLLAHQPKQVTQAVEYGVDLQLSGHTHGGQIWPFHYLVRLEQPVVAGLTRHGTRTWLYTSRGTGFWGPPLRIFAPSEISLVTLRAV